MARTSRLAQRALGALRLTRSFLMLEDDCKVDWEVDRIEPEPPAHPHRVPLRGRVRPRRAGQPHPPAHLCLSPVGEDRPQPGRSRLLPTRRAARRRVPDGGGPHRTPPCRA